MTITIGILSDTHLSSSTELFRAQVDSCFAAAEIILHAGDLTGPAVLDAFAGKKVYAVHGNMCDRAALTSLPTSRMLKVAGFTIALTHGHGFGYGDLEDRLLLAFPEADCIVYGHTHRPACHRLGSILFINPGSFTGTGRHSGGGTYALLRIDDELRGEIRQVEPGQ